MDFVSWCDKVLEALIHITRVKPDFRLVGVPENEVGQLLFGDHNVQSPEYWSSEERRDLLAALQALESVGFVEHRQSILWKVTNDGQEHAQDPTLVWESIVQMRLTPDHEQLLKLVNHHSPVVRQDRAGLAMVTFAEIEHELNSPQWNDSSFVHAVANELKQRDLLIVRSYIGSHLELQSTYKGLVWDTRRGLVSTSKWIDSLIIDWETTSVDFKRELHLDTASQRAEFVKDVLGLANTQASGRRLIIIGFDDRTRQYVSPPDPRVNQNRVEQILADYTTPYLDVRYQVEHYREGPIAVVEVIRQPKKLPYQVAKSLGNKADGDKKRIEQGQIFVRHGSQTEQPTPAELRAIQEEGERARTNPET